MANSSRPPFPKMKRGATDDEIVADAENFFIESLEDWRKANGIETMTLMGECQLSLHVMLPSRELNQMFSYART